MVTRPVRPRIDLGRLFVVPVVAAVLLTDLVGLAHRGTGAFGWLHLALVFAFYALVMLGYLRRGPAVATSGSVTAHAAAVAGTLGPFAFGLLNPGPPRPVLEYAADTLLLAGTTWSVWCLWFLGRNLSIIAQAREVVDCGPYRWVRHPLYIGEMVSTLGLAAGTGTLAALMLWSGLCALQAYRALREEQVLLRSLPGYRAYRNRTAALLPGVF